MPKIAVIAVHGVAYHEPGSSADAVSGLLLGLPKVNGSPDYSPVKAETIHIPLHPLEIKEKERIKAGELGPLQNLFGLEERTTYLTRAWKTTKAQKQNNTEVADDFMRLTLQNYRGTAKNKPKDARDANTYITTRLRTSRVNSNHAPAAEESGTSRPEHVDDVPIARGDSQHTPPNHAPGPVEVDVYEMYWADLSRPQGTVLSFFQALYQLLFHLASLSRLAISTGYLENKKMWQWRALDRMQKYAVRMLTLPIPILNVMLLATIFGALPRVIPQVAGDAATPKITGFATALLAILGYLIFSNRLKTTCSSIKWVSYPFVLGIVAGLAAYWISKEDCKHILLSVEGLAIGAVLVYESIASYEGVLGGALLVTKWLGLAYGLLVFWVWTCKGADTIQQAILWIMQVVLAGLRISWILPFLFAILASIFGWLAKVSIDDEDQRARAKAAIRTSRLALAMPTLGIMIATLALWSGLLIKTRGEKGQYGKSIAVDLFGSTINEPLKYDSWRRWFILNDNDIVPYLDQPSQTVTITTDDVDKSTQVNITASIGNKQQSAQLVVNPSSPALSLSSPTVVAKNTVTATVALNSQMASDKTTVNLSSSNTTATPTKRTIEFPAELAAPAEDKPVSTSKLTTQQPNEYFQGILVWSASPGFLLTLALLAAALFILALWLIPSMYSENAQNVPVRSPNDISRRMGGWLSRGLDSTKIATGFAWCAAIGVPFLFICLYQKWMWNNYHGIWIWNHYFGWTRSSNYSLIHATTAILEYMGIAVTSAAVLAGLAGSGTSVLGIILDVDNYLRTSPKDATPRARIMERYVSLLDYISNYRDPADGLGYDRIVIVAHSLGALISADLLRFLQVQGDSPRIEVRLFTMGNPLRQLLNRFFPYLYEWIHAVPDNSKTPLPCQEQPQTVPTISNGEWPDPNLLGVSTWVNAYRSGDYVGRSLWLNEWYNREQEDRGPEDPPGKIKIISSGNHHGQREEMCIGAGAHQHYWDQSAPDIAEKLDGLISS